MKTLKIALLFYNSILIFTLVTVGFATQSYQDLTPTLLLLPVGLYFGLSLFYQITRNHQLTRISFFIMHPSVDRLRKILHFYSLMVVLLLIFASLAASSNTLQATLTLLFIPFLTSFWFDISDKKVIDQFRLKKIITLRKMFEEKEKAGTKPSAKKVLSEDEKNAEDDLTAEVVSDDKIEEIKQDVLESDLEEVVEEGLVGQEDEEGVLGEELDEQLEDILNVKDKKRRQFLKIIGGGGVSMFLMLFVFQQKASAAFFGSAPGPGIVGIKDTTGTKIDPAEKQPTDGYNITELDDSSSPAYYGFVHKNGAWYIAKEDSTGAYRYVSGSSNFSTNWTNRAGLTYDYFDNVF